jgi:D-alanyl-D-alanine carboxypeptidase (penicillin-binding protein 5/6)
MSFDILAKIVDTSRYSFQTNLQHHTLVNINTMLTGGTYFYKYLLGIKTGSTSEAGSCLVSYATYNGSTYYCVVMDSTYDKFCVPAFADTKPLYQWAFSNFALKDIVDKGSVQATTGLQLAWDKTELQLVAGSQLNALIPAGTDPKTITIVPSTPESVKAPIKAGQKIGEASVEIVVNKKVIKNLGKVDLVASESIARSQPLYFVYMVGRFFSSIWFKLLSAALIILLVLFFFLSFLHNRRKKRRMRRKKIYRL